MYNIVHFYITFFVHFYFIINIKTIRKLKDKSIIDEEYVGMRINAFKAHLKYSNEKSMDKLLSNLDKKI